MYPDAAKLNQELLNIINTGKSNIHARTDFNKRQTEYKKQRKQELKNEKIKVKKLEHSFKCSRTNIK